MRGLSPCLPSAIQFLCTNNYKSSSCKFTARLRHSRQSAECEYSDRDRLPSPPFEAGAGKHCCRRACSCHHWQPCVGDCHHHFFGKLEVSFLIDERERLGGHFLAQKCAERVPAILDVELQQFALWHVRPHLRIVRLILRCEPCIRIRLLRPATDELTRWKAEVRAHDVAHPLPCAHERDPLDEGGIPKREWPFLHCDKVHEHLPR
mmetsp:Transcript_54611/g.169385  ORF Transcript_54611/g.169385 Transcript_54611/m.169385 type:complete len:206 (-) Transcript_54611:212-829(-)